MSWLGYSYRYKDCPKAVDLVLNKMEGIQIIGNVKVTVKTFTDAKELDVQEDATIKEVFNIIFVY